MKVLFLTHRVPYAPNRGDRIRAYHLLRHLRESGLEVSVVAFAHDDDEAARAPALAALCDEWHVVGLPGRLNYAKAIRSLAGPRPLTHVLLDSPRVRPLLTKIRERWRPDLVLAYCSGMARFALEPPLAELPFVLDMVDVDSQKWALLAKRSVWLGGVYRREARLLARFEAVAVKAARRTLVVNERERLSVERLVPGSRVTVVPNGIDAASFRRPAEARFEEALVFTGVFSYEPNAAGAKWLATEVWPLVRRAVPAATLYLVGSDPPRALRRCADVDSSVVVTGTVDDVRPFLWRSRVAAAPLFVARGLQNKVLEALAAGLEVVTTSAVTSGLPPPLAAVCSVADAPGPFADAVIARLRQPTSPDHADLLAPLTWTRTLEEVPRILREAASGQVSRFDNRAQSGASTNTLEYRQHEP